MKFENIWLAWYPWPMRCIHDQGTVFIGADFQYILLRAGIKDVPTTVRNAQANTICKRLHQSVADTLHILTIKRTSACKCCKCWQTGRFSACHFIACCLKRNSLQSWSFSRRSSIPLRYAPWYSITKWLSNHLQLPTSNHRWKLASRKQQALSSWLSTQRQTPCHSFWSYQTRAS
jgi:transposase InsO family protein